MAGDPAPLILVQGGTPVELRVSNLFRVAADQENEVAMEVSSANEAVVTARLEGSGLAAVVIVTPVRQGETTVTTMLKTSAGSATQTIPVMVGPPAPAPPEAVGEPPYFTFAIGGSERELLVGPYFTVDPNHTEAVEIEILSEDESVAVALLHGRGLTSVVKVVPRGVGGTWIRIIVRTPAGSAEHRLRVRVLSTPAEPPGVVGEVEPIVLVAGGRDSIVFLGDIFRTESDDQDYAVEVEAHSSNTGVVTVRTVPVEGGRFRGGLVTYLIITPVDPGETVVTVQARNPAGAATVQIVVTVVPTTAPTVTGGIGPITVVAGADSSVRSLTSVFAPLGFRAEAQSLDEQIVRAYVRTGVSHEILILEAITPGETSVVVTARNAAGMAELTVRTKVLDKLRIGLVSRLGPAGSVPIRLEEGARWNLEIRPLDLQVEGAEHLPGTTFRIATDAPAEELIVPESITTDRVDWCCDRLAFNVEAPADAMRDDRERTYTVSLVSAEGLPSWMELSEAPIRLTVLDVPPGRCEDIDVRASLDRSYLPVLRGTFVVHASHPAASVSWATPYAALPGQTTPTVFTHIFPERMFLREIQDGFEQEVLLRWWGGDLRLTVQAPGCESLELNCDESNCSIR